MTSYSPTVSRAGSGRVGLSEYTAQRLAELRARRAEAEADSGSLKASEPTTSSSSPSIKPPSEKPALPTKPPINPRPLANSPLSPNSDTDRGESPSPLMQSISEAPVRNGSESTPRRTQSATVADSASRRIGGVTNGAEPGVDGRPPTGLGSGGGMLQVGSSFRQMRPSSPSTLSLASRYDEDGEDCIGFASLPEQIHRKAVKRGFDFTLIVVGESGLGKSTLISCLFLNNDMYKERNIPTAEERISKTVQIEKHCMEIEERGVKLRLTIVDTPGFNDSVNSTECWKPIEGYITSQFEQFYKDESGLNRKNIKDSRVHCCLYFISPYGRGLRQCDVELMKKLQDKVNLVPVIAKSDTLTTTELSRLKKNVLDDLQKHNIHIYEFPDCDSDEDEDFKRQDDDMKAAIPFAVLGSSTVVEIGGKRVRGRVYPWGVVEVDSPAHSDFIKLRQFLISTHMQDLKDLTRDVHYENYRARFLQEQMMGRAHRDRGKLKRDSTPNFDAVVMADSLLQQKEEEINQMREMIKKMHAQLNEQQTGTAGTAAAAANGQRNGTSH